MSKTTKAAYPYGEIFVERVAMGWRIGPVLAPIAGLRGGSCIFGNPKVADTPAEAYYEAVNKARNVVKDGNVERVVVRGRSLTGVTITDLAVIVTADIAKTITDPEGCFIASLLPPDMENGK